MQSMQDKYLSIFFKNMIKNDEHPNGIPNPVSVCIIFSIFYKKFKIWDPSTYFVKICGPSTFFAYFESRRSNLCGHVKDMAVAIVSRLVANSSTLCVACIEQQVP